MAVEISNPVRINAGRFYTRGVGLMRTLLALPLTFTLSVGYSAMTYAEQYAENKSSREAYSLVQRLREAILPGLRRSSGKEYNYLASPSNPNQFRAPFKGGQSRMYVNDAQSPFVVPPHTPEGNIFEFRF